MKINFSKYVCTSMGVAVVALTASISITHGEVSVAHDSDALAAGFRDPPNSARPRVWWHWMNGNITKDGIRKDMEWMKRVGIGGLQNFDANLITPQIVDKRLVYMTPEWKDAFRYAAGLADSLDLELAIASSPGWSETGGPWVQPKDGLKKLVWSETSIEGGKPFKGKLPAPPGVTGPFQSLPINDALAALSGGDAPKTPTYYADIKVFAYPASTAGALAVPELTASTGEPIDATKLLDGDLASSITLRRGTAEQPTMLFITYQTPQTVRSANLYMLGRTMFSSIGVSPRLEVSTDGSTWRKVIDVPVEDVPTTVSFAAVTARQFRLVLAPSRFPGLPTMACWQ
jgi:alpha-L-rhamnosidase